jgi:quinol-cytochrome oxidoreductase complex cytochrome b subunit
VAVDYRKQYTPRQLAPFWPNEIIRMAVVSLCTLAVITVLAVLPVVLDLAGLGHWIEEAQPADPRATPVHLRPEWYFLAIYQYLKLPPQELLGMSGKSIGVLSQGLFILAVLLLPLWARGKREGRSHPVHTVLVTLIVVVFVFLTVWAAWPPSPVMATSLIAAMALFCALLVNERRRIRRILFSEENCRE